MQYRRLGRTGYEVSEVGYGAWGIGRQLWVGAEDRESMRALHVAADAGLNFIDTALAYGNGHSEKLIGQFLRERTEQIFIATKVPPKNKIWPARGTLEEVFPRHHILNCAEMSLKNLGVEKIDLLQLHVWEASWIHEEQWYETQKELQHQGKIAHFGLSLNDHQPDSGLEVVQAGRVDTVQVIYNIFDQSPGDRLIPLCEKQNVGVIARVPFDEGSLTGSITPETVFPRKDWRNLYFQGDRKRQVWERVQKLQELLGAEAPTLPELALKFCLDPSGVSTVIPGMRSSKHVQANLAVSGRPPLSRQLMERLREHRWERNFYPA